jgi:hypothetical protein
MMVNRESRDEDAVAPNDMDPARSTAFDDLRSGKADGIRRALCINELDTRASIADLNDFRDAEAIAEAAQRARRAEPCHAPIKRCYGHLTILADDRFTRRPYGFFSLAASAAY